MTSNRTGAVCGWVWSSRNENLQLQVGNHGCQPEKSGVPTRCQGAVTVPSRGVQVWCLVYSGSCLVVRGTRDWQMDWGGIRSDADAAPICCWEERAEHKANLSMYWSVYIPTLDWNTKHNLLKTRLCVQVTMVILLWWFMQLKRQPTPSHRKFWLTHSFPPCYTPLLHTTQTKANIFSHLKI